MSDISTKIFNIEQTTSFYEKETQTENLTESNSECLGWCPLYGF